MKRSGMFAVAIFFSSFAVHGATLTFTTCGATGALGPSQAQCNAAYAGSPSVSVTGGIQSWTVPTTGTYRITATGAQGASGDPSFVGGRGARVVGQFNLSAGQILKLAVGQAGSGQGLLQNGGGGGGSFVVSAANVALLVAGGGGGTREEVEQNGCDASVSEFAVTGSGAATTSGCSLKASDVGAGGIVSNSSWGSAGAGFNSDGASDCSGQGGRSWLNGILGGNLVTPGGFGGGGDGAGCDGGGGGGGYSGGDGGRVAGGGGSFNTGANPSATAGVGTGDGTIVIQDVAVAVATPAIPTLSAWGMILLAGLLSLGAVGTLRRRRK